MNYDYLNSFVELTFPSGNIAILNKARIQSIYQCPYEGKPRCEIRMFDGNTWYFTGTLPDLYKAMKPIQL
jgi:hypothetical protein